MYIVKKENHKVFRASNINKKRRGFILKKTQ
jgi:hypothetical protein